MNITDHNLLDGAKLAIIPGGDEMKVRRLLVIHFTSGMSAQSSIDFWKSPEAHGALAHIIIDRDGTIFQCRAFDRTAGHAGVSRWKDPTDGVRIGCNGFSIGIELANAGNDVQGSVDNPKAFGKHPLEAGAISAKHKNGGSVELWEKYPTAQLESCFALRESVEGTLQPRRRRGSRRHRAGTQERSRPSVPDAGAPRIRWTRRLADGQ